MKKKILIIDDEEEIVDLLRMRFEMAGFEIVQAFNGQEGLNVFHVQKPNLVILDLMMPHVDGETFLKLVQTQSDHWPVPVIVLTAKTNLDNVRKMEGVSEVFTKSLEEVDLVEIAERYLSDNNFFDKQKGTIKKILVVDDEPELVELIKNRLELSDYEVTTAGDGEEALHLLQNPENRFNLIILDICMPELDGYSFVRRARKAGYLDQTPVLILTAKEQMQKMFDVEGIHDYLVKPIDPQELLSKVRQFVSENV